MIPALLRQILRNLGERMDEDLLPTLYALASLKTEDIRHDLAGAGLDYHDPATGRSATEEELAQAARWLIQRSLRTATLRGAIGGAGGMLAIPPEALAALVQTLHLAQRLVVLYGFDLESDRGRLMLSRALAAAWGLELPPQQPWGLRVSHLPQLARTQLPDLPRTTTWIARSLAYGVARSIRGRVGRVVPGLGAGAGAWDARRSLRGQAERMLGVLQRTWEGALPQEGDIVDAVEV